MKYIKKIEETLNPKAFKIIFDPKKKLEIDLIKDRLKEIVYANKAIDFLYIGQNFITITISLSLSNKLQMEKIQNELSLQLEDFFSQKNVFIKREEKDKSFDKKTQLKAINQIIEENIRPQLHLEGGDLKIISLENNLVKIKYQGACGSCPSSTSTTRKAIEDILRKKFSSEVVVEVDNE